MRVAGILLVFGLLTLLDLPQLIKHREQKKKELYAYSVIMGGALLLWILETFEYNLWSPNRVITDIVRLIVPQ
ncbi:hypothetical protein [Ammoniphilus sp. YIM 78166]|uniref:hypothetical protein n=1 Tax=Ammoniphilus sp. YIM 78166 TaxID=1644106 RepID=UPI0010703938|nr:hypothetical protein [Ammoniphilus sp. YIM 78166]